MICKQGAIDLLAMVLSDPDLAATIRLAQNNPSTADADLILSDLTECDFDGYAPFLASALPAPTLNASDQAESDSDTLEVTAGAGVVEQTAYLVYVTYSIPLGGESLLGVQRFFSGRTVVNPGDKIRFKVKFFAFNSNP